LCSWLGPDCSGIITKEAIQETRETAFGEGRGIIVTSTTSTGCILGMRMNFKMLVRRVDRPKWAFAKVYSGLNGEINGIYKKA